MFNLSPRQLRALDEPLTQVFAQHAVRHLRSRHPEACEGKTDDVLLGYVKGMMAFAASLDIRQRDNILRLLDLQVVHKFGSGLGGYRRYRLSQAGLDESTRLHNFAAALTAHRNPVLISLSSDLNTIGLQRD